MGLDPATPVYKAVTQFFSSFIILVYVPNRENRYKATRGIANAHFKPDVEIETECYPWDFSPILNVIVTQLSSGDSHLLPLNHRVT